uniref:G-protein coupled receptors family 1 profile domain-containing protein n=1 Tax=Anabas testudineus TaxID=64144 RepID=A0A7N6F8J1_ANATE
MKPLTTPADYSSYYDENFSSFAPCDNVDLKNFGQVFLPTLYSLVFILGFLGNGLVVCVLVKHRNQTNFTDICLFNLAVSDLVFVLTLPFYAHFSVVSKWTFGDFMCRFVSGCHYTGFFSSIFFIIVMTLDRYVLIIHPNTVGRYRTLRVGIAFTMVVWLLSFSVSLPTFIFTRVINESHGLSCGYDPDEEAERPYVPLATNILGLMVPLTVMVVCYCRIIPTLVNMRTAKKHRVVKLIIAIVVVFFLCWAPYNISIFLRFLFDKNLRLSITVTETIAYTHCCLNPILYAFVGQSVKFMKRAMHLLSQWLPGMRLPSTRDESDSSYVKNSTVSPSFNITSTFDM